MLWGERHVPKNPTFRGLFVVITRNAPAPIWEVKRNTIGQITEIRHRKNWPYIKHYHFHIMDRDWGHVTIRICGYPPDPTLELKNNQPKSIQTSRRAACVRARDARTAHLPPIVFTNDISRAPVYIG
jgi:hypothetical protein